LWQKVGVHLGRRDAKVVCDAQRHRAAVAGHHHDLVHATGPQRRNRRA
jgi:hypothetical protein